jgi:hypothetical protein
MALLPDLQALTYLAPEMVAIFATCITCITFITFSTFSTFSIFKPPVADQRRGVGAHHASIAGMPSLVYAEERHGTGIMSHGRAGDWKE